MQQLQGEAKQLTAELYEPTAPMAPMLRALLAMRMGDELASDTVGRFADEIERLRNERTQRRLEVEQLCKTINSLWITLGISPQSELDQQIVRAEIPALMNAERFQRVKSKQLVVRQARSGRRASCAVRVVDRGSARAVTAHATYGFPSPLRRGAASLRSSKKSAHDGTARSGYCWRRLNHCGTALASTPTSAQPSPRARQVSRTAR